MNPAAVLAIVVNANTTKASAGLSKIQAQLSATASAAKRSSLASAASWQKAGTSMKNTGRTMSRNVTLPIVAAGAVATKFAIDFHDQMGQLENQAGATGKEVEKMSKRVLALAESGKSTHGPRELATALYTVESAGLRGAKAMNVLRSSEQLATVGNAELEETVKGVTTAMKVNLKGTGNTKKAVGQLNAIIGQGRMRMDELNSAMSTGFLTSAKEVGVSLSGIGAALATMTDQGIPATKAATSLQMMMKGLAAPTAAGREAFKGIGLGVEDLAKTMRQKGLVDGLGQLADHLSQLSKNEKVQFLAEAFGVKSSKAVSVLLGNLEAMNDRQVNINKKAREFGSIWRKEMKDPDSKLGAGMAQLETAMVKLGTDLLPVVIPVLLTIANVVKDVFGAFDSLPAPVKKFIVIMALAIAAAGPLLTVIGSIITIAPALGAAFTVMTGPVGLIVMGLIALGVGLVIAYKKVGWFRDAVDAVFSWVKDHWKWLLIPIAPILAPILLIASKWKWLKNAISNVWNWIKGAASTVFNAITWPFRKGVELVKNVIGGIRTAVGNAVAFVKEKWPAIKQVLFGPFEALAGFVKGVFRKVVGVVEDFVNTIISVLNLIPGVDIGEVGGGGKKGKGDKGRGKGPAGPKGPVGHRARGGFVPSPMAIVGEEAPAHPEWVIATNPAYKKANMAYWMQAGKDLGVPGFGIGGALGSAAGAVGGAAKTAAGFTTPGLGIKAFNLLSKGPGHFIDKLPSPGDFLPNWLMGAGDKAIDKAIKFIKDKVGSILPDIGGSGSGKVVAVGQMLQKMGYAVGEHPAFGGVGPGHSATGYHYSGRAIDVNADSFPGGEMAALDKIYASLKKMNPVELLWRVADHYDHLHVAFKKGGNLDTLVGGSRGWDVNERSTLAHIAGMASPGLMGAISMVEAPNNLGGSQAKSSDGGYGLWQMTTGVGNDTLISKYGGPSGMLDPWKNAQAAAELAANASGLGNWVVYNNGTYGARGRSDPALGKKMRAMISGKSVDKAGKKIPKKLPRKQKHANRKKALEKAAGKFAPVGMTGQGRMDELKALTEKYEEWAGAAGSIGTDEVMGVFNGQPESHWIQQQLDALVEWRNLLITALQVWRNVQEKLKREIAHRKKLIEENIEPAIKALAGKKKKTKAEKTHLAALRDRKFDYQKANASAHGMFKDLQTKIGIDAPDDDSLLGTLATLQGTGMPRSHMNPVPFGVLGGSILDAQVALRELGERGVGTGNDSDLAQLIADQLRMVIQRGNVSDLQLPIIAAGKAYLSKLPTFGGSFAEGGLVPGPTGQPRTIIAHGGETVVPVDGAAPSVTINVAPGMEWLRQFIQVEVGKGTRKAARGPRTPGRAGGF